MSPLASSILSFLPPIIIVKGGGPPQQLGYSTNLRVCLGLRSLAAVLFPSELLVCPVAVGCCLDCAGRARSRRRVVGSERRREVCRWERIRRCRIARRIGARSGGGEVGWRCYQGRCRCCRSGGLECVRQGDVAEEARKAGSTSCTVWPETVQKRVAGIRVIDNDERTSQAGNDV